MNAYIFIGVASLVLAFVTVMDNQDVDNTKEEQSLTEYLPSFNGNAENATPDKVQEVAAEPTSNENMFSFTSENKPEQQSQVPTQPTDMFNSNLNSDQGLAQNEFSLTQPLPQPQPQPPTQSTDMFNTNLNSDQGLVQNETPLFTQPPNQPPTQAQGQPQAQQQQYGNPFNGGKNKTGKKNDKSDKKGSVGKKNKKTKRNNGSTSK